MSHSMKIRATLKEGVAEIKALISHPMETGQRKDRQTGQIIPAHFIKRVHGEIGGKTVLLAQWGAGISKNPFLSFQVEGPKKGDTVVLSWEDNRGETGSAEATIR